MEDNRKYEDDPELKLSGISSSELPQQLPTATSVAAAVVAAAGKAEGILCYYACMSGHGGRSPH